jgi:FixJ family two-component response regulator
MVTQQHTQIVMTRNGRTIIVVDDDQAVCSALKFSLRLEGFDVRTYSTPGQLLEDEDLPKQGCFVLDFRLPEMTGLQLLTQLRNRKVQLPAVLITSNPSSILLKQVHEAGARLVEKPLLGNSLVEAIQASV